MVSHMISYVPLLLTHLHIMMPFPHLKSRMQHAESSWHILAHSHLCWRLYSKPWNIHWRILNVHLGKLWETVAIYLPNVAIYLPYVAVYLPYELGTCENNEGCLSKYTWEGNCLYRNKNRQKFYNKKIYRNRKYQSLTDYVAWQR